MCGLLFPPPTTMSRNSGYERASLFGDQQGKRPPLRWGGPQETPETQGLDNRSVHDLAAQKMQDQDKLLDILGQSVDRQKEIAISIGREADEQSDLISDLNDEVRSTHTRVSKATTAIRKLEEKTSASCMWTVICVLFLVLVGVIVLALLLP